MVHGVHAVQFVMGGGVLRGKKDRDDRRKS